MLTSVLCFCLALVGSAQLYSSNGFSNYGYPGAYGNTMGNNYMGAYSPGRFVRSFFGFHLIDDLTLFSLYGAMSGYPGAMSGYPSGMNGLYGQHMLGNNMGSYGLSGYGSPYNRMGSPASYVGRSLYYSPYETFPLAASKKAKKA